MSDKQQFGKNILLSTKFASYLEDKPDAISEISSSSEYVILSANDKGLNEMNENIIKSLIKQGKKVIKVQEPKNPKLPWKLSIATS